MYSVGHATSAASNPNLSTHLRVATPPNPPKSYICWLQHSKVSRHAPCSERIRWRRDVLYSSCHQILILAHSLLPRLKIADGEYVEQVVVQQQLIAAVNGNPAFDKCFSQVNAADVRFTVRMTASGRYQSVTVHAPVKNANMLYRCYELIDEVIRSSSYK